jgi:hypothetical protein
MWMYDRLSWFGRSSAFAGQGAADQLAIRREPTGRLDGNEMRSRYRNGFLTRVAHGSGFLAKTPGRCSFFFTIRNT